MSDWLRRPGLEAVMSAGAPNGDAAHPAGAPAVRSAEQRRGPVQAPRAGAPSAFMSAASAGSGAVLAMKAAMGPSKPGACPP